MSSTCACPCAFAGSFSVAHPRTVAPYAEFLRSLSRKLQLDAAACSGSSTGTFSDAIAIACTGTGTRA